MNPVLTTTDDTESLYVPEPLRLTIDERLAGLWAACVKAERGSIDRAIIAAMRSAWIRGFADGRPIVHAACEPFTGEVNP